MTLPHLHPELGQPLTAAIVARIQIECLAEDELVLRENTRSPDAVRVALEKLAFKIGTHIDSYEKSQRKRD